MIAITKEMQTASIATLERRLVLVDYSTLPAQAAEAAAIKLELRRRREFMAGRG